MMNTDMTGKVALVTGASGGIGLATAQRFAEAGVSVVLSARRTDVITKEAERLNKSGHKALAVTADVTNEAQLKNLVAETVKTFGRLDFAVNNAGVISPRQPTHELGKEDWDKQIAVDLTAVWLSMKHELAHMVAQGSGGAIINISSVSGIRGYPELAAYSAAKHGVIGLTKGTAVEYAARKIRVNAICPGWVDTPMTADYGSDPEVRKQMEADAPMRRTAQPEEIAETIFWLCSDGAGFITGDAIAVDGGQTI